MKIKTLLLCIAALLLIACQSSKVPEVSAPVLLKPVPDIKGLKLGDDVAAIRAKYPDVECKAESDVMVYCQVNAQPYAGSESGILQIELFHERAVMIGAGALEADKFDLIVSAITSKFGKPDDATHRPSKASAIEITWSGPQWWLVATPRAFKTSFAGVNLIDSEWVSSQLKNRVSDAAQNL